jgi:hypothetical protein
MLFPVSLYPLINIDAAAVLKTHYHLRILLVLLFENTQLNAFKSSLADDSLCKA